jgi:NAD(P)-dependent dehydrogenase (short-subunit alcohol dehydrogenase family)
MNKSIIVTGCSGEIGSAICDKLIKSGYNIVGIDNKIPKTKLTKLKFIKLDLEKIASDKIYYLKNKKYIEKIIKGKKISGLIHSAAFQVFKKFNRLSYEDLRKSFDINFFSVFQLFKLVQKNLIFNKGFFINISSIHSSLTKKNFTAYSTSKSALTSLTKSLSIEVGNKIICICIEPGAVDTNMLFKTIDKKNYYKFKNSIPVKKISQPEDIAKLVLFLIESKIEYMNGSIIDISGGVKNILV